MKCGEFFYFIEFSLRIWKNGRIFAASEQSFLLSWLYLIFLLEHWLVKVGVFFVCMRKFLYLCIANKVEKAFFHGIMIYI